MRKQLSVFPQYSVALLFTLLVSGCVTVADTQQSTEVQEAPASTVNSSSELVSVEASDAEEPPVSDLTEQEVRTAFDKAIKDSNVEKAIETYQAYPEWFAQDYLSTLRLANFIRGKKQHLKAIEFYKQALEATDDPVQIGDVQNYIGLVLHDIGRYEESVRWIEKAIANHPSDVFDSNLAIIAKKLSDLRGKDNYPKDGVIYFVSQVSEDTVGRLITKVGEYVKNGSQNLYLFILSSGGDANAGIAAYNYLKGVDINIITVNLSLVASAATYFYCSGDQRYAYPNSRFLFHGTKISNRQLLSRHEYEVNILTHEILEDSVADLYAECSDLDRNLLVDQYLSRQGIILNASESKEAGFISKIRTEFSEIKNADVYTIHKLNKNYP